MGTALISFGAAYAALVIAYGIISVYVFGRWDPQLGPRSWSIGLELVAVIAAIMTLLFWVGASFRRREIARMPVGRRVMASVMAAAITACLPMALSAFDYTWLPRWLGTILFLAARVGLLALPGIVGFAIFGWIDRRA